MIYHAIPYYAITAEARFMGQFPIDLCIPPSWPHNSESARVKPSEIPYNNDEHNDDDNNDNNNNKQTYQGEPLV